MLIIEYIRIIFTEYYILNLYKLKEEFRKTTQQEVFKACESEVRFVLSTEISSIYKKNDKVRKVHNVVLIPSLEAAEKWSPSAGNSRQTGPL